MWDYVLDNRVKLFHISIYELNSRAYGIYERKKNLYSFAATPLKAASYGTFSHNFCFILKNVTCLRASLNVALEWYITFSTKQWCKALKGGTVSLKNGTRGDCLVILP